jgi:hypothetical protein
MALRFRFTNPDDIAAYGSDWRLWDDTTLAAVRSRQLIEIEAALGMPLPGVVRDLRSDSPSILARIAVMWIALRLGGHPVDWKDFDPLAFSVEWERVEEPDPTEGSGEALAPEPTSSSAEASSESPTS